MTDAITPFRKPDGQRRLGCGLEAPGRKTKALGLPLLFWSLTSGAASGQDAEFTADEVRPTPPFIPDGWFNLTSFGGVGDGKTMNTAAFKHAVAAMAIAGGGHLDAMGGTIHHQRRHGEREYSGHRGAQLLPSRLAVNGCLHAKALPCSVPFRT